jgi:citrate lyase subunit beta/citryl-CoA lyase
VHKPKFVSKCWLRDTDAVTFDLEDSVLPSEKAFARTCVKGAIETAMKGGIDIYCRINSTRETFYDDLSACVYPGLTCVHLPKVESAWDVLECERLISMFEEERGIEPGSIVLELAFETAKGVLNFRECIGASKRAKFAHIGQEDFSKDIGIELRDQDELIVPNFLVVINAVAYGVIPIGLVGSITDFKKIDEFREMVLRSKKYGLKGSGCIHPNQVPVLNECFGPDKAAVELSKRTLDIFEESKKIGDGAIALDGRMIDIPIVNRAKGVLARQKEIDDWQAWKEYNVKKNMA